MKNPVNFAAIRIEHHTPLPSRIPTTASKWDQTFVDLKPGSCVVCSPVDVPRVSQALRKSLRDGVLPDLKGCSVMSRTKCTDGYGRVWAHIDASVKRKPTSAPKQPAAQKPDGSPRTKLAPEPNWPA